VAERESHRQVEFRRLERFRRLFADSRLSPANSGFLHPGDCPSLISAGKLKTHRSEGNAMQVGNIQAGAGKLQESLDLLQTAWGRVSDVWRDEQSRRFEEEHLRHVAEDVHTVLPAVGHIVQVLQSANRELSDC
jgi:hypothetical protein